jgi:hypothetical protein
MEQHDMDVLPWSDNRYPSLHHTCGWRTLVLALCASPFFGSFSLVGKDMMFMRRSDMVRAASRREENPKAQTKYKENEPKKGLAQRANTSVRHPQTTLNHLETGTS